MLEHLRCSHACFLLLLVLALITVSSEAQQRDEMQFVRISPGQFMMGCSEGDADCADDEKPAHLVTISKPFEIGKYEVTQAEWEAVMDYNYSEFKGPTHPVENVTWLDAQEFMRRLSAKSDGYRYRFPTEAEWEFAARAGTSGRYSGDADQMGWYFENSKAQTHPVGERESNPWGLYDMGGNVWEWTQDWYNENYYQTLPMDDPRGAQSGRFHTIRGGSWVDGELNARSSNRDWFEDSADFHIGFRCVRESTRLSVD